MKRNPKNLTVEYLLGLSSSDCEIQIDEVAAGALDPEQNMLKLAPHTAEEALGDDWNRPYSRRRACFPLPGIAQDKYWPPVGRIDNVAGDKNLVCTCPPMSAYEEAAD